MNAAAATMGSTVGKVSWLNSWATEAIRASSIATKRRSFWVKHWLCCRTMVM
jgi:hypothetical protein